MGKELPYFKFFSEQWITGDITLESMELQGVFINVCALYWAKDCNIEIDRLKQRYGDAITRLCEAGLIKDIEGMVSISFLNEQYGELAEHHKKNSENGLKGAIARYGNNYLTTGEKRSIFKQMVSFFKVCVKCEGESGLINLEKDHIILTSKGGKDIPQNWQPLCAKCNSSKSLDMTDYRIIFCKKHSLAMPPEWAAYANGIALRGEEKRKEENKGEETSDPLNEIFSYFKTNGKFGAQSALEKSARKFYNTILSKPNVKNWKPLADNWLMEEKYSPIEESKKREQI